MRWFFFILLVEFSAFLLPTTTIYSHHSSLLQSPSSLHSSLLQSSSSLSPEWTEQNGSFFLRPIASTTPPTTCINFLGGALFGASPSLFYGPFLKTLASPPYNYLVVATPCVLTFDHLNTAEQIHTSLEIVRNDVETEYPGLRFCNVGHSFGSLMHVLIETLFRSDVDGNTTNVLIAFNNRNILESVPGFEVSSERSELSCVHCDRQPKQSNSAPQYFKNFLSKLIHKLLRFAGSFCSTSDHSVQAAGSVGAGRGI